MGYGLPALNYRTAEEQGSGGGNHTTGGDHRPEQPFSRTEKIIMFLRGVNGDLESDPDIQYAQETVAKAKQLSHNLHMATGRNPSLDYDVFGVPNRRAAGE